MQQESPVRALMKIVLAVALVGGLLLGGWNVYRKLPPDTSAPPSIAPGASQNQTEVTVVLRGDVASATLNPPVNFYRFDLIAAQREFEASPKLARQFDDFLMRRMHGVTPVVADRNAKADRALANLTEGSWWVHATAWSASGETIEWRLPVEVSGREQSVELTMENAYERTKKF